MTAQDRIVDLLVVGGGTAGIVGAKTAARFGARTVLVEQDRTGGDCLWTGCVPSKTLLAAAEHAKATFVGTGDRPDFAEVRKRITAAINTIEPIDSPQSIEETGATVIKGVLTFRAPGVADVAGRTIRFRQALIATGGAPGGIDIPGLAAEVTVTSETIWDLENLPARLAIVGGGPIACELGQAFARLGSEVTMIVRSRILAKELPEAADLVRAALETDGVRLLEHTAVESAAAESFAGAKDGTRLRLDSGDVVEADVVLLAAGRTPRTAGLGLDRLGVELDGKGHVVTDARMGTSNPRVWAAGDVTTNPQFTHLAGVHASVAASNAVLGLSRRISATVPRVTFTSPEVAAVGLTEADPRLKHRSRTVRHEHVDRAVTDGTTDGFTQLIVDQRGKILGGTIVGPRAGESLAEVALAVQHGLTTSDVAGTTHAYPTYADGVWNAAVADVRANLESSLMRRATSLLVRVRRLWLVRPASQRSAR